VLNNMMIESDSSAFLRESELAIKYDHMGRVIHNKLGNIRQICEILVEGREFISQR
jgi:hypothetical protein